MRITSSILYNRILSSLRRGQENNSVLIERLATQKKLLAPSDDVMGTARAMDFRININDNAQYRSNIDTVTNAMKLTNTVLSSLFETISEARSLLSASANGTSDPAVQSANAEQAGRLRDQLAFLANTKAASGYLFSGFRTDQQPYESGTAPAFEYQGDSGKVNVLMGKDAFIAANVPGNETFSYTLGAFGSTVVKQTSGGLNVHYTQGAGTSITVEIRQADDVSRPADDIFTFSNVIQMADLLNTAIGTNDTARIQALADPFSRMQEQAAAVQADVGARLNALKEQSLMLVRNTTALQDALSSVEDVDMNETAMQLQKTGTALQALYAASAKLLPQSLFDFLR